MARTKDQTEVQVLLDQGALSKHQAARYPRRNVLLSYISGRPGYDLYETVFEVMSGDRILLTSDGFHNKIKRRTISELSELNYEFDRFSDALKQHLSKITIDDDASAIAIQI